MGVLNFFHDAILYGIGEVIGVDEIHREHNEVQTKLKYFKPMITEGFWGKKVTWIPRDKPLSAKEVEKLYDI